jgi:hypothetical protein
MKRRVFLRSLFAVGAGVAAGFRPIRAGASDFWLMYEDARAWGKPLLVVTTSSEQERASFDQARQAIANGRDSELAVRLLLVAIRDGDGVDVRLLTNDRVVLAPPSLVVVDGEPPRVVKEMKLDRRRPRSGQRDRTAATRDGVARP